MNTRFIDWIWNIRGSLALPFGQSSEQAFNRLEPLFQETGTTHVRTGDLLTFWKRDQAAQDKMSIFDVGQLQIERGGADSVLRYRLTSRALLFCFLAPLMFLAFGQATVAIGKYEKASAEAAPKKEDKEDKVLPQNPIDKFLGAPAPEKPKKKDEKSADDKSPKPTAAYVLAALFAVLYVVGRILEAWLVKSLFRKRLTGA